MSGRLPGICQAFLLFGIWSKYEIWTNSSEYSKYRDEYVGIHLNPLLVEICRNISNILKDCRRICGDFIFTAVCHVASVLITPCCLPLLSFVSKSYTPLTLKLIT